MDRFDRWFTVAILTLFTLIGASPLIALAADLGEGETNAGTARTPLENWQYIEGILIPLLVAWLVKSRWKPATQALVMVVTCLIASTGTMWFQGQLNDLDAGNFGAKVTGLIVVTITAYYGFWKPVGATNQIKENVPSPIPG